MSSPRTKSFTSSFLAGSISGTCSTLLFQPLDLVKTRLQVPHRRAALTGAAQSNGTIRVMVQVVRNENLRALWKGLTPSLSRTVPGVGLYFAVVHGIRQAVLCGDCDPTPAMAGMFAATARTVTCAALLPFTVVKTRFESGEFHYRSVFHALRSMRKREGVRGLYSGMLATLLRDVPSSSLYYMFYTAAKTRSKEMVTDEERIWTINFFCAMSSALMACLITHPADVLKTRMQIDGRHELGTYRMAKSMREDEGVRIFFRGAFARIARRSCVIALSWTVYENVIDSLARYI